MCKKNSFLKKTFSCILSFVLLFSLFIGSVGGINSFASENKDNAEYVLQASETDGKRPTIIINAPEEIIEDDKTPLAKGESGEDQCVMHFLILAAAFIVAVCYVVIIRKRHKRILETRMELDEFNNRNSDRK